MGLGFVCEGRDLFCLLTFFMVDVYAVTTLLWRIHLFKLSALATLREIKGQ